MMQKRKTDNTGEGGDDYMNKPSEYMRRDGVITGGGDGLGQTHTVHSF